LKIKGYPSFTLERNLEPPRGMAQVLGDPEFNTQYGKQTTTTKNMGLGTLGKGMGTVSTDCPSRNDLCPFLF
jgi:hypothetical protein